MTYITNRVLWPLLLLLSVWAPGAMGITPDWSATFDDPIEWQQMTAQGVLLVGTKREVAGIEGSTGQTLWRNGSLSKIDPTSIHPIQQSHYMLGESQGRSKRATIFDAFTGKVLFDSKAEGITNVLEQRVLAQSNVLLVAGVAGKMQLTLFGFDLATGTRLWRDDSLRAETGKIGQFALLMALSVTNVPPITDGPLQLDDGSFVFSMAGGWVYRMDARTGNVRWKRGFKRGNNILLHTDPMLMDSLLLEVQEKQKEHNAQSANKKQATKYSVRSYFQRVQLSDGTEMWDKPPAFRKGHSEHVIFSSSGIVVSEQGARGTRAKLLDYDSGKSVWGKKGVGTKIAGGVLNHAEINGALVLVTQAGPRRVVGPIRGNVEYPLQNVFVLDEATGVARFAKPIKVRGELQLVRKLPRALLLVTSHEVIAFDPNTGSSTTDVVRSKRIPLVTTYSGGNLMIYSQEDGQLYRLNLVSAKLDTLLQQAFKLADRDVPLELESSNGNIVLTARQHVVAWNETGKLIFSAYHPAPKQNGWMKTLYLAQAMYYGINGARNSAAAAMLGMHAQDVNNNSVERVVAGSLAPLYSSLGSTYAGAAANSARTAFARLQHSAQTRNHLFMMTRADSGSVQISQVEKSTGQKVRSIKIDRYDSAPRYEVDELGKMVMYQPKPNQLLAYKFQ